MSFILQRCVNRWSWGWNLKAMPLEPKWASPRDQAWKSSSGLRLGPCGPNIRPRAVWWFFESLEKRCHLFWSNTIFVGEILDGTLFVCFFSLGFKSTFKYYSFNQLQLVWIFEVSCDVCRNVDPTLLRSTLFGHHPMHGLIKCPHNAHVRKVAACSAKWKRRSFVEILFKAMDG